MLFAELRRKFVRYAGRQDGKLGQWLPQPVDRECGDPLSKGGGVNCILDLFRKFAS